MRTYILQLEPHDDITSTRDKMAWSKTARILLVWPRRRRLLHGSLDLILVQRRARELGLQLAIVTRDTVVIEHAREIGIPVFSSVQSAETMVWKGSLSNHPAADRTDHPQRDVALLREQYMAIHQLPSGFWQAAPVRLIIFAVGVLAVLALGVFFLPGAMVTISPARREQSLTMRMRASPDFRSANPEGALPARLISVIVEGQAEIATTGQILVSDQFASGTVRFTSAAAAPVDIPAGTVVRTIGPIPARFELQDAVQVPGGSGSTVDGLVRAVIPGKTGNVAANQIQAIEGTIGLEVKVNNPEALKGGSEKQRRAAAVEDVRRLREKLQGDLKQTALNDLSRSLKDDDMLLPLTLSSANVLTETLTPELGQPSDQLQMQMRAEYSIWTIGVSDLRAVAYAGLDVNLPKGYVPLPGTLVVNNNPNMVSSNEGKIVEWQISASQQLQAVWNQDQVISLVLGQTPLQAAHNLQESLLLQGNPDFSLSPPWWIRMPYLPFRITVAAQ